MIRATIPKERTQHGFMSANNSISLKEQFIQALEHKIISGELSVGDKLPSERELADSMHVSRAVVNTGIAEMVQKGFLVVKPRVGTFVEDYRKNGTLEAFVSIMNYKGGDLTNEEIRSILELRIAVTSLGVTLCCEHATDEELLHLNSIMEDIEAAADNAAFVEQIFRLNHEIAFISQNHLLPLLFTSFKELACHLWHKYIKKYGRPLLEEHTRLFVSHIIARDSASAILHTEEMTQESIDGSKPFYS